MSVTDEPLARTRKKNDQRRRKKLRAKLRTEGVNEELIEKIMQQQRTVDLVKRHGPDQARQIVSAQTSKEPDDTGYKPTTADPLLRGVARVDGIAAKVVRRRDTITQFQYDLAARRQEKP